MNEHKGQDIHHGEHLSPKHLCPKYFQFWKPGGWLFRVQLLGTEIKWGKTSNWGAFFSPSDILLPRQMWVCLAFSFFLKNYMKRVKEPAFGLWLHLSLLSQRHFYILISDLHQLSMCIPWVGSAFLCMKWICRAFAAGQDSALWLSSSSTVFKLTWEAVQLVLWAKQVDLFSLCFFFPEENCFIPSWTT